MYYYIILYTPLGHMLAISDEQALYMLHFTEPEMVQNSLEHFKQKTKSEVVAGQTQPLTSIDQEIRRYFAGILAEFMTPTNFLGTPFQKQVWEQLRTVPAGKIWSYYELAQKIGKPSAVRAVAGAVGANRLGIIVPCHRIINKNGSLGGYNGGLARKEWLLNHEKS
jgi:AraC family transcriptional regulator, regulatory protein of adaptative response / methylated-DNA-[protein]-cysteine methyltransferase